MHTRRTAKRIQHLGIDELVEYDGITVFCSPLIVEFIIFSFIPSEYPADLFHCDMLS
jgi:hypothetical protein